jgi:hypothetical protein
MNDYKKYLLRQMGLKEAQFVPFPKEDEFPGIDPADQMVSPTAKATPIIGVAVRGSVTGGLPSGADQETPDLAPTKLGGYNRVSPEDLNTKLVDKTPANPEIKQETNPINQNPSTGQGVTHPHQIQVTAGEEPQETTGASTDSDPTLKLKSGVPKGIDIDITEKDEEPTHEEENPMIPTTSLSEAKRSANETFARHRKLMLEKLGLCSCGCKPSECKCPPSCKCGCNKDKKANECATCGCGDPTDTHGHGTPKKEEDEESVVECLKCHNKFDFNIVAEVAMGAVKCPACNSIINQEGQALFESKHKAGCQCGFCKNKGSFGKKKEAPDNGKQEEEEGKEEQDEKKEKLNENYAAPFSRMRGLAGLGKVVLASNGNWTDTTVQEGHPPGASHPFVTHWKMDPQKAGMVKVDEEKLKKVKATLDRKSKRGTLSDKELVLAKRLNEVLKRRGLANQ